MGPKCPKYCSILLKFAPEVAFTKRKKCSKNHWKIQIFTKTKTTQSLHLSPFFKKNKVIFCPNLVVFHKKLAKIKGQRNGIKILPTLLQSCNAWVFQFRCYNKQRLFFVISLYFFKSGCSPCFQTHIPGKT